MKYDIENLLFRTKGVVNFNAKDYIEVQPGITSPLLINVKLTLNDVETRQKLAQELAKRVDPKSACVCGIESGGSYYASAVADILQKPLVLFRKKAKLYGAGDRFVGSLPPTKNGLVSIIDDVIAGGRISTANNDCLRIKGYRSELIVIYSYLPKMVGPMAKIKVSALSDINTLCKVGLKNLFFTQKDVDLIKKECVYSNK